MIGFIYIMSNPAYPGDLKIGQTKNDPEERRKELGSTGVLHDYVLEYRALSEEYESLEREIHRSLAKQRVRPDREFFTISVPEAINKIREIAGERIESDKVFYVTPEELQKIEKEEQEKIKEEQEKIKEKQERAIKQEQRETAKFFRKESIRRRAKEEIEAQKINRVSFRPGAESNSRLKEEQVQKEIKRKEEADDKWAENTASFIRILFVIGIGLLLYFQFIA